MPPRNRSPRSSRHGMTTPPDNPPPWLLPIVPEPHILRNIPSAASYRDLSNPRLLFTPPRPARPRIMAIYEASTSSENPCCGRGLSVGDRPDQSQVSGLCDPEGSFGDQSRWPVHRNPLRFDDPWLNYGPMITTPQERFSQVWSLQPVPPGQVAQVITAARQKGWRPAEEGRGPACVGRG